MSTCARPGCGRQIPSRLLACREHWFELPQKLRNGILAEYSPGQETRHDYSDAYLVAFHKVVKWWDEHAEP